MFCSLVSMQIQSRVRDVASEVLRNRKFIVVSNREPYEHVFRGGKISVKKTSGGLVSALDPVLQEVGGMWIAWGSGSADKEVTDDHDTVWLPPGEKNYQLKRVWLSDDEIQKFYFGHVNQTLWPLCHGELGRARFLRQEWEAYESVNKKFAQSAAQEIAEKESVVWFQDYHFSVAPGFLRIMVPQAKILQFWHIPWPSWEMFRLHPHRREILEGMLGCDFIGMHIDLYCDNFIDCVQRELRIPVDFRLQQVIIGNRVVRIKALPISIDAKHFDTIARAESGRHAVRTFVKDHTLKNVKLAIGVERMDYTKGILLRLKALDHFFRRYPEWRGKCTYIQISSPSREEIPAYRMYDEEVTKAIRSINRAYGTPCWKPVIHLKSSQTQRTIAALLRAADVGIVSSRHDGMNLVAKEFVASQVDRKGVLMLSEFAGAAEELPQAIIINPFDTDGFSEAIHHALRLPLQERRKRMLRMRQHLFANTIDHWIIDVLESLESIDNSTAGTLMPPKLLDHLPVIQRRVRTRERIELFCDYDGVLTSIAPRPEDAVLDPHVRDLLTKLRDSSSIRVHIISGRSLDDVAGLVGVERLTYSGNHGLEIRGPKVDRMHPLAHEINDTIQELYDALRDAMQQFPGVIVEYKRLTLSVHYRLATQDSIIDIINLFHATVRPFNTRNILRTASGKAVMEVRPNIDWDKGKAVKWILTRLRGDDWPEYVLPMYLGDDETDEDAFRALRRHGMSVLVGRNRAHDTIAKYMLENVREVVLFLEWLTQHFP